MWVYDGEEWTHEGGSDHQTRTDKPRPQWADEFVPELQVIEIVQLPKSTPVPPISSAVTRNH